MSQTPRTDAEERPAPEEFRGEWLDMPTQSHVSADFARQLERELVAMTVNRDKWQRLAMLAADEAAGWYDEARGGDRKDLSVVRKIDEAALG